MSEVHLVPEHVRRRWPLAFAGALLAALLGGCGGGGSAPGDMTSAAAAADDRKAIQAEGGVVLTDPQALTYIATYDDLIMALGLDIAGAKAHYSERAVIEGRVLTFDPLLYVATYPDLITGIGANAAAATRHFITDGFREKRNRGTFDTLRYTASYPDLIAAYGVDVFASTRHYITVGYGQGRTPTFDALRYIASHGDLIRTIGNNVAAGTRHYIVEGYAAGRRATFDAARYVATYSDLQEAFGNDLAAATMHFIVDGFREGRTDGTIVSPTPTPTPTPTPDPGTNPDPAAEISDTFFLTGATGWRIDKLGKVFRSQNGGATYTAVGSVPVGGNFKLAFGTETDGWVLVVGNVGIDPRVFRSTDGGVSWVERTLPVPPPSGKVFASLKALGASTLVITNGDALTGTATPSLSDPRQIIFTRDGGQIWIIRNFDPVHITGAGVMFSIAGGQVLKTINFAQSITATTLSNDGPLLRVGFADELNGLVVGRTGTEVFSVWRTRDGGNSWTKLAAQGLPTAAACTAGGGAHRLVLSSADNALFSVSLPGCTATLRSTDGGLTWTSSAG